MNTSDPQLQMIWPENRLGSPPPIRIPPGYRLRIYHPGDEPGYYRLMASAGWPDWDDARLQPWLARILPDGWFMLVEEASDQIAASAMGVHDPSDLHPFGGELNWVAADPAQAGKGLGAVVSAAVTARLIRAGYRDIHLYVEPDRLAAVKTCLKLGYVPFLYSAEMAERWKALCVQVGWAFTPELWGRLARPQPTQGDISFSLTDQPDAEDVQYLGGKLSAYNLGQAGYSDARPLAIFLRDADGQLVGGLQGWTYWDWFAIDLLWLSEEIRGRGYGSTLLRMAENEAAARGCGRVLLDTFSFQSPAFYQKHGYEVFGMLDGFAAKHRRYYLCKNLT